MPCNPLVGRRSAATLWFGLAHLEGHNVPGMSEQFMQKYFMPEME
jgi:hypothetical protein